MLKNFQLKPPFFEIGPKSYLVGDEILELALAADIAAEKYGIDIIFTTPVVDIRRVAQAVKHLFVFAPHMEPIEPGRGLADILPESLVAAGAHGVMLNHCEKPLSFSVLAKTIDVYKRQQQQKWKKMYFRIFVRPDVLPDSLQKKQR